MSKSTQKQHGPKPFGVLQPDFKESGNGYGLLQLTANFAFDSEVAGTIGLIFRRGAEFPGGVGDVGTALAEQSWTCIRHEVTGREGNVIYVSAQYAAIDKNIGGDQTETEATITSAVVSEPIESHPNFTKIQCKSLGAKPLGGTWTDKIPPGPDEKAKNEYRANWAPISSPTPGVVQYNFAGFLPSNSNEEANRKAGVRSWMRPSITMKLTSYMTSADYAQSVVASVGGTTTSQVGTVVIPDCYKQVNALAQGMWGYDGAKSFNWLVTGSNMEVYGGLYKVTADMLLSGVVGWDNDIYPKANL